MDAATEIFLWGVGGSIAVEIAAAHSHLQSNPQLPERYRKPGFYVVRLLLAIAAGGITLAYKIANPVLAIHVGAATPLILQALASTNPIGPEAAIPARLPQSGIWRARRAFPPLIRKPPKKSRSEGRQNRQFTGCGI